jgi:hypothetical protein
MMGLPHTAFYVVMVGFLGLFVLQQPILAGIYLVCFYSLFLRMTAKSPFFVEEYKAYYLGTRSLSAKPYRTGSFYNA